jgi:hypothetical protein
VGKGTGNRYRSHLSTPHKQHPLIHKIRKIRQETNQDPYTVIIASFDTEDDAYAFEIKLIAHYKHQSIPLTNLEPGGRIHGPCRSPNVYKKRPPSTRKGIPRTTDIKQKISTSKKTHHPTAKHWLLISPDGVEYRTKSLCQTVMDTLHFTHNNYKVLINAHLAGKTKIQRGTMAGWQIFELI